MKVGLISKLPHCKPHARVIQGMGFELKKLGPSPTRIPKSLDILVVRVDSVSHGGDAVARKWARTTNKPVVYENGVSGIRRELSAMVPTNNLRTPPKDAPWVNAFSESQFREAYLEVKDKFAQSPGAAALTEDGGTNDFDWKEFTYRIEPGFIWNGKPVHSLIYFYLNFHKEFVPYKRDVNKVYRSLTGKSVKSNAMCLVAWYLHFSPPINAPRGGKKIIPSPPPATVEPGTEKGVELRDFSGNPVGIRTPDRKPGGDLESSVEANTNAILEVMEDLSAHKSKVQGVCDCLRQSIRDQSQTITALEAKLAEAIKAGFDPRTNLKLLQMEKRIGDLLTTQLQNHKHDINRTLCERVAALESGITVDREGVDEWKERFEQVKEELRGDISNAFDALAAEQPSDDVSASPLAALERIKVALKAAGFKGTLTLTIE